VAPKLPLQDLPPARSRPAISGSPGNAKAELTCLGSDDVGLARRRGDALRGVDAIRRPWISSSIFLHAAALHRTRSGTGSGSITPPGADPVAQRAVDDAQFPGDLDAPAAGGDALLGLEHDLHLGHGLPADAPLPADGKADPGPGDPTG
jgi:hypothetical protein